MQISCAYCISFYTDTHISLAHNIGQLAKGKGGFMVVAVLVYQSWRQNIGPK